MPVSTSRFSTYSRAHIKMHLSVLLWGLTGVLGRAIELNEALLVWYRMLIVAVTLFLYVQIRKHPLRVSVAQYRFLALIGFLLMVHWVLFYGAIKYSNVSITMSMFASTTLFTALLEPLITPKKFDYRELIYSFLALIGIGMIYYTDTNNYQAGIVLAILAAFVGAFFNILNKSVVNELPVSVVTFYEIVWGVAILTPFIPFYVQYFNLQKLFPTLQDGILLFILAVLCTHVPLLLSLSALRNLSAFTLNLVINLEPVYAIMLAFIIYRENKELNTWFFAGVTLILTGVVLHAIEQRPRVHSPS
ncbi:MAG: DMT family transporter [Chitinophagales bacterium]|nr:DMT family transporter [Chitinophagales bacterium]